MKTVAPDCSATLMVRDNGSYRAYAFLQRKGSRRPWSVTGIQPAEIDVKIGMGPTVFDVSLPQGALARTLEEIAASARKMAGTTSPNGQRLAQGPLGSKRTVSVGGGKPGER